MPRYLISASYASEGAKGLLSKGGTARRGAVEKAAADLGGRVETFDFAFGSDDVYTIIELPDNATAAAFALTVSADGRTKVKTTVLLSPEEIDDAAGKKVNYAPPGTT
ncbi:MAG: GYD domain-containing protein [Dermatophilaceae bacterium]